MGSDIAELLHCKETSRLRQEAETTVYDLVDISDVIPKLRNKETPSLEAISDTTTPDDFSATDTIRELLITGKTKVTFLLIITYYITNMV